MTASCGGVIGEAPAQPAPSGNGVAPGGLDGGGGDQASPGATPGKGGSTPDGGAKSGDSSAQVASACAMPLNAGATPMRRLTGEQYANTVRDLLGIARPNTDALGGDETIGPFRTNTVAAATDLVAQQYLQLAEALARSAVAKVDTLVNCNRATLGDDACGSQFIDRFGLRAYRRPLTDVEKSRYKTLLTTYGAAPAGFANGIRVVVQTMLQSPHFLYHVEPAAADGAQDAVVPVGPYPLATRLSYFLWNSMPDGALLDAAAAGTLADSKGIRAQVDRMLKDPKARDAISSFHLQWLGLDRFDVVSKDNTVYPTFTGTLRTAMKNETVNFADYVIRKGDGRLETLLTAPYSVIDGGLFDLYQVTKPANFVAGEVVPLNPAQRAGLLTQAAFLADHANANQSSPVQRGVVIRKNVLCQSLPDPPDNVANTPPEPSPKATTRQRFTLHETSPSCSGCHKLIDGVGFGFENYDGVGAYRETEAAGPVDATGALIASRDSDGAFVGAVALAKKLGVSGEVRECVAKQWFRFSLGRLEADEDSCSLARMYDAFAAANGDVRELLATIATTDAFRNRHVRAAVMAQTPGATP